MKTFWDERYNGDAYVYGTKPNEYFAEKIKLLPPGLALFGCEGEGRNAVYAAKKGWQTYAFDQSTVARRKALDLAQKHGVSLNYTVTDVENAWYPEKCFDLLVLIFAHFPEEKRREYHRKLGAYLKPGGLLIVEGFSKEQIRFQKENPCSGGPENLSMLMDAKALKTDFSDFEIKEIYTTKTLLNEGKFHSGRASVVRIFGVKN